MPFQKGQSGNAKGRPKKDRELTSLLDRAGSKKTPAGVSGKRWLASAVWNAATQGAVTFPDGHTLRAENFKDWAAFVQWIYVHVDGPAKQQTEITGSNSGPVQVEVKAIDYRVAIAALAPRSMGDSDTSGESQDFDYGPEVG